jgi:sugar/nucleoside kinase (ribokinase family)
MTAATPAPRVVCIGVATLDAVVRVDRVPGRDERVPGRDGRLSGGGVAATAAVALARLGVPVAFVGRVGDDEVGRWIRDGLASEGVDVTRLRLARGRSPLSAVLVDGSGARSLAPYAGDAGRIELSEADLQPCDDAEWVHLDHAGYPAWRTSAPARGRARVSLDGGVPILGLTLDGIDLYAPTETALLDRYPGRSLAGALEAALGEGPSLVVATRGAEGSVAVERRAPGDPPRHHAAAAAPLPSQRGGSTLGAGDVFHGALLAALVEQLPIEEALRFANTVAALSCRGLDGRSAIPTRSELEEQRVTV